MSKYAYLGFVLLGLAACSSSSSTEEDTTSEGAIEVTPNERVYVGRFMPPVAGTASDGFSKLNLESDHAYHAEYAGARAAEDGIWYVRGKSGKFTLTLVPNEADGRPYGIKIDSHGNLVVSATPAAPQVLKRQTSVFTDPVCGCFDPLEPDCCSPHEPTVPGCGPHFELCCACAPDPMAPPGGCCGI